MGSLPGGLFAGGCGLDWLGAGGCWLDWLGAGGCSFDWLGAGETGAVEGVSLVAGVLGETGELELGL